MKTRIITAFVGSFFLFSLVNCAPDSPTYRKNDGLFSSGKKRYSMPTCKTGQKKKKKVATFK